MHKNLTIRQHGRALAMTIPAEFIKALGLKAGDAIAFNAEGDTALLRFYHVETSKTLAVRESAPEVATIGTE